MRFIKLWDKIMEHKLYPANRNREFSGFEAFIDLLFLANGNPEPKKINRNGVDYFIQRGEIATTQRQLSKRWHWSLDKVNRTLSAFKSERTLRIKPNAHFSVIAIENYDFYNPLSERTSERKPRKDQNANANTTNEIKEIKERNDIKKRHLDFVLLSEREEAELRKVLEVQFDDYLSRLNSYIGSKGVKYKSHYYTLLSWYRKDHPSPIAAAPLPKQLTEEEIDVELSKIFSNKKTNGSPSEPRTSSA